MKSIALVGLFAVSPIFSQTYTANSADAVNTLNNKPYRYYIRNHDNARGYRIWFKVYTDWGQKGYTSNHVVQNEEFYVDVPKAKDFSSDGLAGMKGFNCHIPGDEKQINGGTFVALSTEIQVGTRLDESTFNAPYGKTRMGSGRPEKVRTPYKWPKDYPVDMEIAEGGKITTTSVKW